MLPMKNVIKLGFEGFLLGIFTVIMTVQIMRLVIPKERLDTYTVPHGMNGSGVIEVVVMYIIATIILGSLVKAISKEFNRNKS